jgi:hypothetical protein
MNWRNAGEAKYATILLITCIFHSYPILKNEAYHFFFKKKSDAVPKIASGLSRHGRG